MKIILLLVFVSVLWACQKKEYATFTYSQSAYMYQPKSTASSAPVNTSITSTALHPLSASASEGLALTENETSLSAIPIEAVSSRTEQGTAVAADRPAPAKITWQHKVIAKKIQKQIKKADSPEKAKATKAKPNTIALLSLLFSGGGLLLLLLLAGTSLTGLGFLLGIAGLVLGIVGLSRIKKDLAPASSKTMALLGVIFGGLITLVGLAAVVITLAYFLAF